MQKDGYSVAYVSKFNPFIILQVFVSFVYDMRHMQASVIVMGYEGSKSSVSKVDEEISKLNIHPGRTISYVELLSS